MKKPTVHTSLRPLQAHEFTLGFNQEENEPVILLITDDFNIQDINETGAQEFFKRKKQDVINQSLIDLFLTQEIDTKKFLNAFKQHSKQFFKYIQLEHGRLGKQYIVTIVAIHATPHTTYAITMMAHDNYHIFKSYMSAIINNLPGSVYWKDLEGHYLGCNKFVATMAGFDSTNDIIGKTDYDLCWKEFADEWRLLDKQVIKENKTIVREEKAKLANGNIITELTYKTPLKNEHGEIIGIIGTSLDITDRKEMEAALHKSQIAAEAANQAKSEFLRNMEHQLRTPFSGVYSMVEVLAENEQAPDKKELLEITYRSAKEFLELLNDIIEFSRNQAENTVVLDKKLDLKKLITKTITMQQAAATYKQLTLKQQYPTHIPTIWISDPNRIQRIIMNLLSNAIKFSSEGSITVKVKLAKKIDDKHYIIQLVVTDMGIGIPADKQALIYEKFYRVHPANQNKYAGAGLGLYVVKQLIEELEGEIDVVSTLQKGTTFICTLPLRRPLLDIIIENDE